MPSCLIKIGLENALSCFAGIVYEVENSGSAQLDEQSISKISAIASIGKFRDDEKVRSLP